MPTLVNVAPTRLKSSFIYLANAVNDLRGNWTTLALILAPATLIAALCLLPDALNLQHGLAARLEPGGHSVVFRHVALNLTQVPYNAGSGGPPPLFPGWALTVFHLIFLLITLFVELLVLCAIKRIQSGVRKPDALGESIAIYGDAFSLAPAFAWVSLLQVAVPVLALVLMRLNLTFDDRVLALIVYFFQLAAILFGALVYLWLYFAGYALVISGTHSFHALLASRDLMRKRFFRTGMRIAVFLAVWSGYNSWAAIGFIVISLILGPVGAFTGYIGGAIFIVELAGVAVTFVTAAFFVAAGLRLYQDLVELSGGAVAADGLRAGIAPA